MATPVELERLIVRLIGDTKVYQQEFEKAKRTTAEFEGDAREALTRVENDLTSLGSKSLVAAEIATIATAAARTAEELFEVGSRAQETARFFGDLTGIVAIASSTIATATVAIQGMTVALQAMGVSLNVVTALSRTLIKLVLRATIVLGVLFAVVKAVTFVFRQLTKEGDEALANLNKQTEELNASLDRQLEMRKRERRAATDYIRELKIQAETFGLSSRAAQIYRISLGNVTDEQLAQIRAADENLKKLEKQQEAMEKQARFQSQIDKLNERLQLQAATFGMTARQAEIYRLRTEGATEAQLRQVISADKQLSLLEAQNEEMKKGEAISKRFFRAMEQNRKATEAQGKAIAKQFLTPAEKLIDRMKDLNRLLRAGAINQETFTRASLAAVREAINAQAQAPRPQSPARLQEAISVGSNESRARQEEFLASLGVGEKARPIERAQLEELKRIEKVLVERLKPQNNEVVLEEANFRL